MHKLCKRDLKNTLQMPYSIADEFNVQFQWCFQWLMAHSVLRQTRGRLIWKSRIFI